VVSVVELVGGDEVPDVQTLNVFVNLKLNKKRCHQYRKNKETSFRVRLQSTTARYISVGILYKHKARFAWVSSAWLGFIKVHIKYNGICGARCYLAPRLYI
jgi:hypothetical protein